MTEVIKNEETLELEEHEMEDAEAMFQALLGEDPDMMRNSISFSAEDIDVDVIKGRLHEAQLKEVKGELDEVKEAKNKEIEELKAQLAKAEKKRKLEPAKDMAKVESSLEQLDSQNQVMKSPIIEKFAINADGLQAKFLNCRFFPDKGKLGIEFKRFGEAFFVTAVVPGGQASTYVGLNRGLLIYQIEIWKPKQKGLYTTIQAERNTELVNQVATAMYNKNEIVIKFCIPPKGVDPKDLEENVIPPQAPQQQFQQGRGRGYPPRQQFQQAGYRPQQQFPMRGLQQQFQQGGYHPQQQFQQGRGYPSQQQFQQGYRPQQQFQPGRLYLPQQLQRGRYRGRGRR